MIYSSKPDSDFALILRNTKSFTGLKLINAIIKNPKENRRENMLNIFEGRVKKAAVIFDLSFWSMRSIQYYWIQYFVFNQRLNYLHCKSCNSRVCKRTVVLEAQ
jgi:hypothetical protein